MLEKTFKLKEHGTTVKTEVLAGITTFLAMAYILAVNPNILGTVMNQNGVFIATCLSSAVATFVMGLWANYPIVLSAGLGLNAYFAYTVCLSELSDMGADAFTVAITAVFVEGVIFIVISAFKIREQIVNSIPQNIKFGITAGIGLFVAFIGLKGAGVTVASDSTLVDLGDFSSPEVVLCLVGLLIIVILTHYHVKGSVLIGIIATWILGIIAEKIGWYVVDVDAGVYSLIPSGVVSFKSFAGLSETAFHFNFAWAGKHLIQFIAILFSFLFVDLFDTVGTVVGVADKAHLLNEDGTIPRVGRVFMADAVGTVLGSCLGTSTITSFVESSAGVAEGGRTGLTACVSGLLFIIALIFSPIFLAIPSFATSPALIYVGMLMISSVTKIKFDGDVADSLGAYLAIAIMPLTYSISNGIMFAIVSWVIVKVFTKKAKDINPVMWVIFVLFALRIASLVANFS